MKKTAKKVSLVFALEELALVLDGIRILAEELAHSGLSTKADTKKAPTVIATTLATVVSRVTLLRAIVRGQADAAALWSSFNDASASTGLDTLFPVGPAKVRRP